MYIKSLLLIVAACAVAVSGVDFHSDEAAKCATDHWDEIRAIANPKLSMMDSILPKTGADRIKVLLDGKNELPAKPPSRDWLRKASDALPPAVMDMFGKDIIDECLKNHH
ncbi:hypothetical protein GGI25_005244 [Coemansia spiralis]|uniref:Uncharacterized protein n=2 Tax=Coemansia TaxID=4863 RepID=A0A9W8KUU4_9FUNG|nr:hypothetical protein BX070DRAFT_246717 [Coemansia spiralis]KAJ1986324.1 hypothetical protein EDC05_006336 [Coemansia umbellata]KAJ2621404.1 hypothetical protein GGI26_004186 [Coemansia sp. RSA 1358]KAJ2672050.1 hypothetical protein GGI25_005244 [Coemansia spiralis]